MPVRLSERSDCRIDDALSDVGRRGVTIIEVLVVIGIIALLVAIVVPALFHARQSARSTRSATNCKQLATLIVMYADRNAGRFPVPKPGQFVPAMSDQLLLQYPYWDFHRTWPGLLYDELPYQAHVDVYRAPNAKFKFDGDVPWPSSYSFTLTAGAPGELWVRSADQLRIETRVMRLDDVFFPSSKGMLWEVGGHLRAVEEDGAQSVPIGFMDLSVRALVPRFASEAVSNTTNSVGYANARIHNTERGLQGVDY
jgi:prepilin-type N-terminal cleavage/methylation domain-containing protein